MKRRPVWRSLGGRIVLLFLALLLAVQGLGYWLTRGRIEADAQRRLAASLDLGASLLGDQLRQHGLLLAASASTLGADYGLLTTLQGEIDPETVASALEAKLPRLRLAQVAAVLDPQGRPIAVVGASPAALVEAAAQSGLLTAPATEGEAAWRPGPQPRAAEPKDPSHLVVVAGQPMQLVRAPIAQKGSVVSGILLVGSALAEQLPALAKVSQTDVSLLVDGQGAVASTLNTAGPALQALLAVGTQPQALALGDDRLQARQAALASSAPRALHLVLSLSVEQAIGPATALQRQLLLVSLLGVALFSAGSLLMAQRLTAPMQTLVDATRRLGQGDFDTPLPAAPHDDELADLSQAFEGMRSGLAERTEHIRRLAYWDGLTGLANRAQFEDRLREVLADSGGAAVLMLNLDRLERVNQVLGRTAGDAVLRQAALRLRSLALSLPEAPPPLAARLGGDEFALLLPGADAERGLEVARALGRAFTEHPLRLDDSVVDLSAGIGVAAAPEHADAAEALLARALLALTEAKRRMAGVLAYDPSIDAGSAQTLSLLGELRQALRRHELRLYLQPKLDLGSGQVCGAEALVRWQHPQRGLVPPVQFIPFAEETGFIHELTLWVVNEAARLAALLQGQGLALTLSVNLSAHDLMKPDLLPRLRACLQRHQVAAAALCLEITESAIAHDPARALQTLHALKSEGFRLSIDDFGAGQTSLAQLLDLPVDELKLDMLFVRTMDQDAAKASMVGSLVRMGHDRRLSVVAEGVENAAILEQLRALGCDLAQGWHVGKPMPAGELASWVQARAVLASVQRA